MQVFKTAEDIRSVRKQNWGLDWGFIPTMGSLHEGHLSLIKRARSENDRVGVSIFVNPKQFNNADDLAKYPRNPDRDLALLESAGVDLVWMPEVEDVYPPGFQTYVDTGELGLPLEGASRPGHFKGVCTIVTKLFNVFQPYRAYFGQKDAQQALIIRRMVRDLNFDIRIVMCPTFREPGGLAMSSRNVRLNQEDRQVALVLNKALTLAQNKFSKGEHNSDVLIAAMYNFVDSVMGTSIDYISINDTETLEPVIVAKSGDLVSLAVEIDGVRLIDNIILI